MAVAIPRETAHQEPIPQLERLERLIGTWELDGEGIAGCVSFEWMVGGFFLVQHVEIFTAGRAFAGTAYIGWEPEPGELRSIWFGENESPLERGWSVEGREITIGDEWRVALDPSGAGADCTWERRGGVREVRAERAAVA